MPARNLDFDSAIRQICDCSPDALIGLRDAAVAKLKALGLSAGSAVQKAPKHGGRRNVLAGFKKGSGDINLRGLLNWIDSLEPLEGLDDDAAAEMQKHHEFLKTITATLNLHAN